MKDVKSKSKISVTTESAFSENGRPDVWGISIQEVNGGGAFIPFSTARDAQQALSLARSTLDQGYNLHAYRKVVKLEIARSDI